MSDKQRVISDIYYVRGDFGYKQITVNDSRKVDDSSQQNIRQKKQLRGYNSFVAPQANNEYQMDLMFFSDLLDQQFKVSMACIDIFGNAPQW